MSQASGLLEAVTSCKQPQEACSSFLQLVALCSLLLLSLIWMITVQSLACESPLQSARAICRLSSSSTLIRTDAHWHSCPLPIPHPYSPVPSFLLSHHLAIFVISSLLLDEFFPCHYSKSSGVEMIERHLLKETSWKWLFITTGPLGIL